MNNKFPKHQKSSKTGDTGVNIVSQIVNDELGFIFKRNDGSYDFGIDAYIEIVAEDGSVTGQVIGVQIKCGNSFFKTKTKTGWRFYGEEKHLNYYLNSPFPIIICICDPDTRSCFWEFFEIEKTNKLKNGWSLNIPKRNVLSNISKSKLLGLVGNTKDFTNETEEFWQLTKDIAKADILNYSISKEDILSKNYKGVLAFFERLLKNDELALNSQGKVMITIDGYCSDHRELWEIRDVQKWARRAENKLTHWFFFCSNFDTHSSLIWFFMSLTKCSKLEYYSEDGKPLVSTHYDRALLQNAIEKNFETLNQITEQLELPIEENNKITRYVAQVLGLKQN
ncbi:DUF4365 and DUF1817 domain-containing protein [Vibrio parahaemolyticus]|nr:DUF4365 and DUF1817 domain-containing protein [Vibrio parahaemolyticus]